MHLLHGLGNLLLQTVLGLLAVIQRLPHPGEIRLLLLDGRGKLLDLALPSQQIGHLRLHGTAGHGAAGVHHVALQRY